MGSAIWAGLVATTLARPGFVIASPVQGRQNAAHDGGLLDAGGLDAGGLSDGRGSGPPVWWERSTGAHLMALPPMIKHRGFPGRLPGTDAQFIIRRANPKGITPLTRRERHADRRPADRRADAGFMKALWDYFGDEPFERGNLDAGRLSWLWGREVIPAEDPFDTKSYQALMRIDVNVARASFPEVFE